MGKQQKQKSTQRRRRSPPRNAFQLSSVDDVLVQAIDILKLCRKADETSLDREEFDLSYPLMAAVSLLEHSWERDDRKIIQAASIVKAVAVTLNGDMGQGFAPSYPLDVAIDLIDRVSGPRRQRPKPMRKISTVDPAHARAAHRLLAAAGKLPMTELEQLVRRAEIVGTGRKTAEPGAAAVRA